MYSSKALESRGVCTFGVGPPHCRKVRGQDPRTPAESLALTSRAPDSKGMQQMKLMAFGFGDAFQLLQSLFS